MEICMSENEINNLKINMTELSTDVKYIKETLEKHIDKEETHLERFNIAIEKFMESTDRKYASKKVETIFWSGLGVIGSTIIIWAIKILLSHN
jgi:hypothetical protein